MRVVGSWCLVKYIFKSSCITYHKEAPQGSKKRIPELPGTKGYNFIKKAFFRRKRYAKASASSSLDIFDLSRYCLMKTMMQK